MGGSEDFVDHGTRVLVKAEWVEGSCGISVEQRRAQRVVVHDPAQALIAIILAVAETAFPLPSLKVIAELTQITSEAAGEFIVMRCNLVGTQSRFQTSVVHAGRERNAVYDNRLALVVETRTGEWVKRIL